VRTVLISWSQLCNEAGPLDLTLVPADVPFPKTFKATVKNIFKRLFRVYAHIYYSHFGELVLQTRISRSCGVYCELDHNA